MPSKRVQELIKEYERHMEAYNEAKMAIQAMWAHVLALECELEEEGVDLSRFNR